jgi:PAS domain S-box-containing protein
MKEKPATAPAISDKDGIGIVDAIEAPYVIARASDNHVLCANEEFAAVFGYDSNELFGRKLPNLWNNPDTIAEVLDSIPVTGSVRRYRTEALKKDGSLFWVQASIKPLSFKNEDAILFILDDITASRAAETAIADLRRRNEQILQSAGEGIYGLDTNGETIFLNPAAAEILGWQREDLIGKPQHAITHHSHENGDFYPREDCPIYQAFKDGKIHTADNEVFWRKDGTSLPVEYTSTPMFDENKELVGAVVTFRDISERKKSEAELKAALAELENLKNRLEAENTYLQEEIKLEHNFDEIIGSSDSFKRVLRSVEQVASTDATVLILGETGTGKELIARAVHRLSPRKDRPLVKVNCAALPNELIESELFGHEKGAFTNAVARKPGRFELAHGGTIFLDEIGDLPLEQQAKLLRVLQDGEFERVGGTTTLSVDVRVIAATNAELEQKVTDGEFREDLYYRLNVFPLIIPPLRERPEDIALLAHHFVHKYSSKMGRNIKGVPSSVLATLQSYRYQGNVRELENIIERAVILAADGIIRLDGHLQHEGNTAAALETTGESLDEIQKNHITAVLNDTGWRIEGNDGAAVRLGLKASTLRSRMQKLGVKKP